MSKLFIIIGNHPSQPGEPIVVRQSHGEADAAALDFVNLIREEPLDASRKDMTVLPQLPEGSDWREGLKEWQIARLRAEDIFSEEEIEDLTDEGLVNSTGANLTITEIDAPNIPSQRSLDLYRALADGLSHLVEEVGTINKMAFPDDYQWMVEIMSAIASISGDPGEPRSIDEVRALGRELAGDYAADQAAAA